MTSSKVDRVPILFFATLSSTFATWRQRRRHVCSRPSSCRGSYAPTVQRLPSVNMHARCASFF